VDESPRSERWIVIHREHKGSKRTKVRALNDGLSSAVSIKARSGRKSGLWTVDCHPPWAQRLKVDGSPRSERWIVIRRERKGSKWTKVRALNDGLSSAVSIKARSGRKSALWTVDCHPPWAQRLKVDGSPRSERWIVIHREHKGSKWTTVRAL